MKWYFLSTYFPILSANVGHSAPSIFGFGWQRAVHIYILMNDKSGYKGGGGGEKTKTFYLFRSASQASTESYPVSLTATFVSSSFSLTLGMSSYMARLSACALPSSPSPSPDVPTYLLW